MGKQVDQDMPFKHISISSSRPVAGRDNVLKRLQVPPQTREACDEVIIICIQDRIESLATQSIIFDRYCFPENAIAESVGFEDSSWPALNGGFLAAVTPASAPLVPTPRAASVSEAAA